MSEKAYGRYHIASNQAFQNGINYGEQTGIIYCDLLSAEGKMSAVKNYSVVNGNIDHVINQAVCRIIAIMAGRPSVFMELLLRELKKVVDLYILNYLEETDLLPTCADDWKKIISDAEEYLAKKKGDTDGD